jgi:ribosome-associated heat shock protein Hsp15
VAKQDRDEDDEDDGDETRVRMDKWLWAARFFKTRRLAIEACDRGHVKIGEHAVKPSRAVHVGELLRISKEGLTYDVTVVALSARRGPATEAAKLYSESEASRKAREEEIALRRAAREAGPVMKGRPTKRARRALIHYFAKGRTDE